MIRFALVFALFVAAAQATEVNLLRGSERRLTGPGDHGPENNPKGNSNVLECPDLAFGTTVGRSIGQNPLRTVGPAHASSAACTAFCNGLGKPIAHYHAAEHPEAGKPPMHCRCHNVDPVVLHFGLTCPAPGTEGSFIRINLNLVDPSIPITECPDPCGSAPNAPVQ